jgi:hypothetical protein
MAREGGANYLPAMFGFGRQKSEITKLLEARESIKRQIMTLNSSVGIYGRPDNRALIAELESELQQINELLGERDAKGS